MKTAIRSLLLAAMPIVIVACGGGGGTSWTFSAPVATSPAASGSAGASASPGASAESPIPSGPAASPGASSTAGASPSGSAGASPSGSAAASPSGSAAASPSGSGGGDVIDLAGTATLQWVQNDQPVTTLTVPAGRPVTFRVDNVAGFDHNFWIGDPAQLSQGDTSNATGIDTWQSGVRETQYTFEAGQTLEYACTVPGHYPSMHGTFTIQP
jgi:hypothetical protein